MMVNEDEKAKEKLRKSARKSGRKSSKTPRSSKLAEREPEISVVIDKLEPEKTEISKMNTTLASDSVVAPANTLDAKSEVKSVGDPQNIKPEASNVEGKDKFYCIFTVFSENESFTTTLLF